jgi:hypothetical protein
MNTPEKKINQAKIYIQNGSRQHLKHAEDLLRQIQNDYSGTAYATQASALLNEASAKLNKLDNDFADEPPSDAAINLDKQWAGISRIEDAQLQPFLQALFNLDLRHEVAVTKRRHEVINKLSGWIKDVDNEIWLDGLVKPVLDHPDFEHQLDEVLGIWWEKKI